MDGPDAKRLLNWSLATDYPARLSRTLGNIGAFEEGEPKPASDADALEWVPLDLVESFDLTPSFRRFFLKNKKKLSSIVS